MLNMNDKSIETAEKPEDLVYAEQLMNDNRYIEALEVLKEVQKKKNLPLNYKVSSLQLQARLLMWLGRYEDSINMAEQAYNASLERGLILQSLDPLFLMALVNNWRGDFDESYKIIKKIEAIFKLLTNDSSSEYIRIEALLNFIKGFIVARYDATKGLELLYYSLSLWEQIDVQIEKAMTLLCIGLTHYSSKGELDLAIKYLEQGLMIAKEMNNKFGIAFLLYHLGNTYSLKGDLDHSLAYFQNSLKIYDEINNREQVARLHNLIADVMREKGNLDLAFKHIETSLLIYQQFGVPYSKLGALGTAIELSIEKGDVNLTYDYLNEFKKINKQFNSPSMNLWMTYYDALILKNNPRMRDKAKAEELLEIVLEKSGENFVLSINILTHLCDLYLTELQTTNNLDVLEDINPLISKLLDNSTKSRSYYILCQTYMLKAKLALITLEIKKARKFLSKAQQIANNYGMNQLSIKISNEHDELLQKLNIWEELRNSNADLSERLRLTNLEDQIKTMVHKRRDVKTELTEEIPIMILVISEGGIPTFTRVFTDTFIVKDDLISSFLVAFNTFSGELFSEGLDRAMFGEYSILMKSISPFLVCYLFKGQSYLAQDKLQKFIDKITKNKTVWQTFNERYQTNQEIQLRKVPLLDAIITEIFLTNSFND